MHRSLQTPPMMLRSLCFALLFLVPLCARSQTSPLAPPDVNRPSITIPAANEPTANAATNPEAVISRATSGSSTGASVSAPSGYQLSSNDAIGVEVFGEDDLRTQGRVDAEGNVSVPLLGSIHLGGVAGGLGTQRISR